MKYQECLCEIANLYLAGDINSVKILDKVLKSNWRAWRGNEPLAKKGWFLELKSRPVLHCQLPYMSWELSEIIDKVNEIDSNREKGYADKMMQWKVDRFNRRSSDFLRY